MQTLQAWYYNVGPQQVSHSTTARVYLSVELLFILSELYQVHQRRQEGMCIILPVDHIPCTHTVAIWQHCVNAPRSFTGLKPCSRIRQHARPILTRKQCFHCGGPRYFARRGGIAERGNGSPTLSEPGEEKEEMNESYDSGYHSDVIHEEDEDVDDAESSVSPRASAVPTKRWRDVPRQRSPSNHRSHNRRPSWRPNLKRDLNTESFFNHRASIDSTISNFDDESSLSSHSRSHSQCSTEVQAVPQSSAVPILRRPSPKRKASTLLHPSPPLEATEDRQVPHSVSVDEMTPPATPPQRPGLPPRQDSTLLHPSSPELEPTPEPANEKSFPFDFELPERIRPEQTSKSAPPSTNLFSRPGMGPRKNSSLLHPSSPSDSLPSSVERPFPIPTKSFMSWPPTPQATPTHQEFKRRNSILHSALSDDEGEWEAPMHSSMSDVEYDSDNNSGYSAEGYTESFHDGARDAVVMARSGRIARASRVSLHGNQLRILAD